MRSRIDRLIYRVNSLLPDNAIDTDADSFIVALGVDRELYRTEKGFDAMQALRSTAAEDWT